MTISYCTSTIKCANLILQIFQYILKHLCKFNFMLVAPYPIDRYTLHNSHAN